MNDEVKSNEMEGQLSETERALITAAVMDSNQPVLTALEVGTWYGGGSTLHILRALARRGAGRLWGIEADQHVYEHMVDNMTQRAGTELLSRFTPLHGFSDQVIPRFLAELPAPGRVDFVFLDGGDNPLEQIVEFKLLADRVPVGGQILSHDAKLRKGRWFVPYISKLSNWKVTLHDVSAEGLLITCKTAEKPTLISKLSAEFNLMMQRLRPVELAAAILPPAVNGWLLAHLPKRIALRLSQGRS